MATTKSKAKAALVAYALGLPGAWEDHPWGETVAKVGKKVFAFFGVEPGDFGVGVKLPESGHAALELPFVEPAGYGLGKSGWVSVKFGAGEEPPAPLLREWIHESYCAVAPKTLVKQLSANGADPKASSKKAAAEKASSKKPAAQKTSAKKVTAKTQAAKKRAAKR